MKFWNIVKTDAEAELRITGDIVDDDNAWLYEWFGDDYTAPNRFREELEELKGKPLTVWIDSYGGSVFAAVGIYNALKEYKGQVTVVIDAKAMSAATIIAMAGDSIEITPGAIFMIHNPLSYADGYASDLRKVADVLDTVKTAIVNIYVERTKLDRDEISALMDDETYMSAARAVELGFADSIRVDETANPTVFGFRRLAVVNSAASAVDAVSNYLRSIEPPLLDDKKYQNMLDYLEVEDLLND